MTDEQMQTAVKDMIEYMASFAQRRGIEARDQLTVIGTCMGIVMAANIAAEHRPVFLRFIEDQAKRADTALDDADLI